MAANDPEQASNGAQDPRLASLDEQLQKVRRAEQERTAPLANPAALSGKGAGQGQRVLSALLGAPLGAALIGWVFDRLAGTAPRGLLIMLFLGFGAAISQVIRISKERAE